MENTNTIQPSTFQDTESSNFNLVEWIFKMFKYWYLFVAGMIIALGLAYLKNRSWLPTYQTSGTVLIDGFGKTDDVMQGFGVTQGYGNISNQVIILQSYDFIGQVVDSMPYLSVDYINMGRFKTRNLYSASPILIESEFIDPIAYGQLFKIELYKDGTFDIGIDGNDNFELKGKYGLPIDSKYFNITVYPTVNMVPEKIMYFRFRNRESLISDFMSRLSLKFVSEYSTVLSVGLVSATPDRDKDFIDKMCELYLANNLARKNDVANNTITFINSQLENISQSLSVSETAMTDFRQKNEIVSVSSYAGQLMGKVSEYDEQQLTLRLKETYLDYLTNYLKDKMATGTIVAPSSLGLNEAMLMSLVQQLNNLQLRRNEIPEKNVFYSQYTKDIDNVKESIQEVVKSMRASLEIEKEELDKRYAEVRNEISKLPEKEMEMVSIERNYRIDDNYYTFFLQKRAEAEIQKASNTPDNDILDKARTTVITNASDKSRVYVLFLVVGLLIPMAFVLFKELLNNTIRTDKDVEKLQSPYTLLGTIRHTRTEEPALVSKSPRSSFAEMFRNLRTRIEFVVQRKNNITLLITSAQSGDGKTYFSINLAAIYALTGKKTVLVDIDIRKPNVHDKLNLKSKTGITNYLIGDVTLDDIILTDTGYDFDVILSGTIPPNPGELVRSEKLQEMFRILKQQYEYILIDTSPIGLVADAYPLMEITDVNLFIIRSARTNKNFCKNVLSQLVADHASNLFLVLNDLQMDSSYYYSKKSYGGNYGYGYGYGSKKQKKEYDHYYTDDNE